MSKLGFCVAVLLTAALSAGTLLAGCGAGADEPVLDVPEQEEAPEPVVVAPVTSEPELPKQTELEKQLSTLDMGFGFSDEDGVRILISLPESEDAGEEDGLEETAETAGEEVVETAEAEDEEEYTLETTESDFNQKEYTLAIGPYGQIMLVHYSEKQAETEENNHRHRAGNFDNLPGYVYRTDSERFTSDKTYVLTTVGPLMDAVVPLSPPGWKGNTPSMEEETIESIQAYKGRNVEWGKKLATTYAGALIGVVLFEREGDDMLFSIVYIDEAKALFWDCPAVYNEEGTWRVGVEAEPGTFGPLFLTSFNGELALFLTWQAPDAEYTILLYEKDGAFERWEDVDYTRIWR